MLSYRVFAVSFVVLSLTSPSGGSQARQPAPQSVRLYVFDGRTLDVADTGPGISDEYLPHILAPFSATQGEQRTGLRLARDA